MSLFDTKYLLKDSSLPTELINNLSRYGIVSAHQLSEMLDNQPALLQRVTHMNQEKTRALLSDHFGTLPTMSTTSGYRLFAQPPLHGLILSMDESSILVDRRANLRKERRQLTKLVEKLKQENNLPLKMDLTPHLPTIGNQGGWGSCVGWASTAARQFPVPVKLSPGWAYNGAKSLDGHPNIEGSWLNFAFEYLYRFGHVPENLYTYQDARNSKPMEAYHSQAAKFKIDGFVDLLLDDKDFDLMPTLLKGILSGIIVPKLGPQPVAIGIAVHESARGVSTYRSGLWTIPMPGEERMGGHAMTLVGYIDREHPNNPFGKTYFLVRNSWGTEWASENPLGYAGHGLIPEGFFKRPDCFHEGILSVAEVSPMKELSGVMATLWNATKKLMH